MMNLSSVKFFTSLFFHLLCEDDLSVYHPVKRLFGGSVKSAHRDEMGFKAAVYVGHGDRSKDKFQL